MNALILVDLQNDFMPGGALAVTGGHELVPLANQLMPHFDLVVATQDWHPPNHQSFASQHPGKKVGDVITLDGLSQVLWPDHCIQGTRGAAMHNELNIAGIEHIATKGTDPRIDSYSGFYDNGHRQATGLGDYLRSRNIARVAVMGLATDYCVKSTVMDAVRLGFETRLIEDGCRGVELTSGDINRALQEMQAAGVGMISASSLLH